MSAVSVATPTASENLLNIGRSIDRLVTVEMRLSTYSRGVIGHLHQAAQEAQGGGPLSMRAAQLLQERIGPGDVVFVLTGAGDRDYLPAGETDGPPGVVALAAALSQGLGAVPLLFTELAYVDNLERTALAAGLGLRTADAARRVPGTTAVMPLADDDAAVVEASSYLDLYMPRAVISIEKLGPNSKGVAHTATGRKTGPGRARAEVLIDEAQRRGILTVGVGDNGNEIGFGLIEAAVREYKPYGDKCQCDCGAGLATRVATDVLVPANTSNWGAYGIAAALAALLGKANVLHSPESERRIIEACVAAGAADGSTGRHILQVDGTPLDVQVSIITLLRTIVVNGLATPPQRPF